MANYNFLSISVDVKFFVCLKHIFKASLYRFIQVSSLSFPLIFSNSNWSQNIYYPFLEYEISFVHSNLFACFCQGFHHFSVLFDLFNNQLYSSDFCKERHFYLANFSKIVQNSSDIHVLASWFNIDSLICLLWFKFF